MRRFLVTATLLALCTFLTASSALAIGARHMPGNEILITKALKARGVIPAGATAAEADAIVTAYIEQKVGTKPEDRANRSVAALPSNEYPGFGSNQHGDYNIINGVSTDKALVLLVDFGGPWKGKSGPLHGEILPPLAGDNTTFWPGDFSTSHYQNMLFGDSFPIYAADGSLRGTSTNTFKKYYLEQSHGTYTVTGNIADWVTVPYPESYYGKDSGSGTDDANGPVWRVVEDAVTALAARDPNFDWAQYDHENPWGIVAGGFNQPDGYVDHLILVHAGADQSAGGGAQGDDAIWAHSWWVDSANGMGPGRSGGFQIPGSSMWVGPYTINPEDGGIGVFSHEFGHDLGLPDQYNYDGSVEATPGFWSLMDSGSWLGDTRWGLDTAPAPMDAWSKYYLGWVDPVVVARGATARATLAPSATGDAGKTTVRIDLPAAEYTTTLSAADGNPEWYSDMGDNLNNKLTTASKITLPAVSPALSFLTWYDIETGYDYGMVEVSMDGLAYTSAAGNLTSSAGTGVYGITGTSSGWVSASYDLSAWAGKSVYLRFRYFTDGGVALKGWEIDNIAVNGGAFSDTADSSAQLVASPAGSWSIVDGQKTKTATRYYIADYRTRLGFDAYLANCYNFLPASNTAQFFSYNTGLLLQYRNTAFLDNEILYHPGEGGWSYVDSHPTPDSYTVLTSRKRAMIVFWRTRIQVRDAAFGLAPRSAATLLGQTLPGYAGQPSFDDSLPYWFASKPDSGVKLPQLGVSFTVTAQTARGLTVSIDNVK
jgi:immune inhibitor A